MRDLQYLRTPVLQQSNNLQSLFPPQLHCISRTAIQSLAYPATSRVHYCKAIYTSRDHPASSLLLLSHSVTEPSLLPLPFLLLMVDTSSLVGIVGVVLAVPPILFGLLQYRLSSSRRNTIPAPEFRRGVCARPPFSLLFFEDGKCCRYLGTYECRTRLAIFMCRVA